MKSYLLLYLAGLGIAGCSSREPYVIRKMHYASDEDAMRIMQLNSLEDVCWLPHGYKTSWNELGKLFYLAKTNSGGSEKEKFESLKKIMNDADINKDYILTVEEISRLKEQIRVSQNISNSSQ